MPLVKSAARRCLAVRRMGYADKQLDKTHAPQCLILEIAIPRKRAKMGLSGTNACRDFEKTLK